MPWGCLQFVIVVFPDHTHYFVHNGTVLSKIYDKQNYFSFNNMSIMFSFHAAVCMPGYNTIMIYSNDFHFKCTLVGHV